MGDKLLTPKDVAELLNISIRTVYDNARRLGGFYPFGIKVLRFRPEDIYEGMERQQPYNHDKNYSRNRNKAQHDAHSIKTDPNRHGL